MKYEEITKLIDNGMKEKKTVNQIIESLLGVENPNINSVLNPFKNRDFSEVYKHSQVIGEFWEKVFQVLHLYNISSDRNYSIYTNQIRKEFNNQVIPGNKEEDTNNDKE